MLEVLNYPPLEGWRKFGRIFDGMVQNTKKNSLQLYLKQRTAFLAPMGTASFFVFFGEGNQVREKQKRYSGQREIASYLSWRV
ncbi:hypothetical protein EG358_17030 [Chryseobacterium indoltheticum]|nr:hypothetical protein EG358_17030 [Chryseobacterium indoltheticum]